MSKTLSGMTWMTMNPATSAEAVATIQSVSLVQSGAETILCLAADTSLATPQNGSPSTLLSPPLPPVKMPTLEQLEARIQVLENILLHFPQNRAAQQNTFDQVIQAVTLHTGVSRAQILSKSRPDHIVWARNLVCYIIRNETGLNHTQIGNLVGLTHSGARHAIRDVDIRCEYDPACKTQLKVILSSLPSTLDPRPSPLCS